MLKLKYPILAVTLLLLFSSVFALAQMPYCTTYNETYYIDHYPLTITRSGLYAAHETGSHWWWGSFSYNPRYRSTGIVLPDGNEQCYNNPTASFDYEQDFGDNGLIYGLIGNIHRVGITEKTVPGVDSPSSSAYILYVMTATECPPADNNCTTPNVYWTPDLYYHVVQVGDKWPFDIDPHKFPQTAPRKEGRYSSPLVIDLEGKGFADAFTSLQDGIRWDFDGFGHMQQMAWTNPKRKIGFLFLDRMNKGHRTAPGLIADPPNGKVDSAFELFSDIAYQPILSDDDRKEVAANPQFEGNGFRALAYFDLPYAGGNGDGKIDAEDQVWSRLKVWVDTAHDGDSRNGDEYTLDELGIKSISTKFVKSPRTDKYGNQLRFQGTLEMVKAGPSVPPIYDVFFVSGN
jgi:hypothetical protein